MQFFQSNNSICCEKLPELKEGTGRQENCFLNHQRFSEPNTNTRADKQRVCIHIRVSCRHQLMLNRLLRATVPAEGGGPVQDSMKTAAEHQWREQREARTAPTVLSSGRLIHFSAFCIISFLTSIFKNNCDCYTE